MSGNALFTNVMIQHLVFFLSFRIFSLSTFILFIRFQFFGQD